jgi:hypothetical protein
MVPEAALGSSDASKVKGTEEISCISQDLI